MSSSVSDNDGIAAAIWTLPSAPGTYFASATLENEPLTKQTFTGFVEACPNPITLQDDFAVGNQWTTSIWRSDGSIFQADTQYTAGGNPGGYRRMTHTVGPPLGASFTSTIWVAHLYTGATYTPNLQGSITSLRFSEDQISFTGNVVNPGVAVRQHGITYIRAAFPLLFSNTNWVSQGPFEVKATDFATFPPGGPALNFSSGTIEFGYLRSNTTRLSGQGFTTEHGIDNWKVEICRLIGA